LTAAQQIYNSLFPYYAEVCVLTQLRRRGGTPGGWGGHASLFLNGAAIDSDAGFPRLRPVEEEAALADADSGTGVSVNQIFTNVNWVAIPGRTEFFRGGLAPDRTLDQTAYDTVVERASRAGWFAGIRVRDSLERQRPTTMSPSEFIVRSSIGTDFALNFARTAYCARLPMTRDAMSRVIGFLNDVNASAQAHGYTWSAYTNNCSHVTHNALAAAGIWDPKEARGPGWENVLRDVLSVAKSLTARRMSDLSFPANNFVRAYEAGNERPIDDPSLAATDHDLVRTVAEGWTSTGPGALIVTYPMHEGERNELFTAGRDPFLFSVPVFWDKDEKFRRLTRQPSMTLTDLKTNLVAFRERYERILAGEPSDDLTPADGAAPVNTFRERLYRLVSDDLRRTNARLDEYERLTARPGD
jgi:hypothetical protein